MKKFLLVSTAVLALFGAEAQNPTLYFMRDVPMRSQMNAALAPERGYVQIPLLGGLAVADDGNIALNNLVYRRGDQLTTLLDPSVSAAEALSGLHDRNRINADVRTTLIGFGSYTANRKNFWSFDLNLRAGASAQVPYELFHFFKTGESSRVRNMGVAADTYVEAGFNYSWPVCDRVYVGARVKALIGLARTRFYFNDFNVSLGEDQWFAEAVGELEANGAGVSIPTRTEVDGNGVPHEYYELNDMSFKPKKPAGYGVAFDLGVAYEPIENLLLSAAINDLGFIAWSKKGAVHGSVNRTLTFDGAQVDASGVADIDFNLGDLEFEKIGDADGKGMTRMLRYAMNVAAEYDLWSRRVGFGLLYQMRKYDYMLSHDLAASVNFHPVHWFTLSGSYSFIDNGANAVGLGLNLHPGWINFYVATDVLLTEKTRQWVPIGQSRMYVNLGLAIPLGRRGLRLSDLDCDR